MPRMRTFAELWLRDPGSAAASRPALRRHGGLPGRARCGRAARARQHARPRRHPVGQGRLRRHGHRQGRSARPRHDGGAAGRHRAGEHDAISIPNAPTSRSPSRAVRSRASAAGRSRRLRPAAEGRHHRRLPGRVARADGDAAAAQADAASTTSSCRWRSSGPGRSSGRWCIPYLNRRAGREPVVPLHPSLEPVLARTLGVPLFQEQLLRMAMVAAGFTGGQAEELRRAMGFKRSEKRMKQIEVQLREGMARQRHHRRDRRADHHLDHVVRALRLSRVARRQLRAAGLRERVSQGALPGGVLHGAPQQPADGVLSPGDARQGRAAPRRALPSDRRAAVRLAVPRRGGRRASASGFMYVNGLRKEVGQAMAAFDQDEDDWRRRCCAPKCGSDDESMIEVGARRHRRRSRPHGPTSATSARTSGRCSCGRSAASVDRGRRAAHRPAPRRADDAGRHRRAERVHQRAPQRAVAGGARRAAGGRAVRERVEDERADPRSRTSERSRIPDPKPIATAGRWTTTSGCRPTTPAWA